MKKHGANILVVESLLETDENMDRVPEDIGGPCSACGSVWVRLVYRWGPGANVEPPTSASVIVECFEGHREFVQWGPWGRRRRILRGYP